MARAFGPAALAAALGLDAVTRRGCRLHLWLGSDPFPGREDLGQARPDRGSSLRRPQQPYRLNLTLHLPHPLQRDQAHHECRRATEHRHDHQRQTNCFVHPTITCQNQPYAGTPTTDM